MSTRRMAFIEYPALPFDVNAEPFRQLGFEIAVYCQITSLEGLLDLEPRLQSAEFDTAMIYVDTSRVIPQELLDRFRQILHRLEQRRMSPIRLVGWNWFLSEEEQRKQAEIFDGLFMGRDSTEEQISVCLRIPKEVKGEQVELDRFTIGERYLSIYWAGQVGHEAHVTMSLKYGANIFLHGYRVLSIYIGSEIADAFYLEAGEGDKRKLILQYASTEKMTLGMVDRENAEAERWVESANAALWEAHRKAGRTGRPGPSPV